MKNFIYSLEELFWEFVAGFSVSSFWAVFQAELIHSVFVVWSGVLGTIAIHYTRKFLKDENK